MKNKTTVLFSGLVALNKQSGLVVSHVKIVVVLSLLLSPPKSFGSVTSTPISGLVEPCVKWGRPSRPAVIGVVSNIESHFVWIIWSLPVNFSAFDESYFDLHLAAIWKSCFKGSLNTVMTCTWLPYVSAVSFPKLQHEIAQKFCICRFQNIFFWLYLRSTPFDFVVSSFGSLLVLAKKIHKTSSKRSLGDECSNETFGEAIVYKWCCFDQQKVFLRIFMLPFPFVSVEECDRIGRKSENSLSVEKTEGRRTSGKEVFTHEISQIFNAKVSTV